MRMLPRNAIWIALGVLGIILLLGSFGGWAGAGMMAFGPLWMLLPLAIMAIMLTHMLGHGLGAHAHDGGGGHASHGCMDHGESHASHADPQEDARAIVERRYASGEITRDEYQRMRRDLQGGP